MKVETDWLATALSTRRDVANGKPRAVAASAAEVAALRQSAEDSDDTGRGADLEQARVAVSMAFCGTVSFKGSHEPSWLDKLKAQCTPGFHAN